MTKNSFFFEQRVMNGRLNSFFVETFGFSLALNNFGASKKNIQPFTRCVFLLSQRSHVTFRPNERWSRHQVHRHLCPKLKSFCLRLDPFEVVTYGPGWSDRQERWRDIRSPFHVLIEVLCTRIDSDWSHVVPENRKKRSFLPSLSFSSRKIENQPLLNLCTIYRFCSRTARKVCSLFDIRISNVF